MKIRIELEENLSEDEVVIRCRTLTDEIGQIQNAIASVTSQKQNFILYKEDTEFYVAFEDILFFETESNGLNAHTREDVYQAKYRLYELEELLPSYFLRVSKSSIVNVREIFSIQKSNLSTTSVAAFENSHKQVYVSRHYAKALREKIMEVRKRR